MDEFQYNVKFHEMHNLTTKKSKQDFISEATKVIKYAQEGSIFDIKLCSELYALFKDDKLTGVASIPKLLNAVVFYRDSDLSEVNEMLTFLPKTTTCTATNDYNAFMYSPGIPAHLKLLVLKAQLEQP